MDDLEGSTSFGNIHIEAISHMAPSTLGHQSASYVSSGSGIVVVVAVAVFAVLLLLLLTFVILIILIILNIINVNINQSSSSTWSSSPPSSSSSSSSAVIWHKASNNIKPNYVLVCWIDISLSSCNIIVLTTSVPLPSGTVLDCVYVLSSFKIRCMHHEKVIPKASPTSDVAASSFEVSASICSTAWRQQPSSTWVKKRVAKTPHISLLQSNLLLCWQPVAQSHTKSTASSFCWGDGSSQTCHQEAQIHIITQLPVFGQNKREKKTCMMNILTAIRPRWDFNTISDRTSIESSNKRYSHGHNPCQISDLILSLYYSPSLGFSWKAKGIFQNALICMTTKY